MPEVPLGVPIVFGVNYADAPGVPRPDESELAALLSRHREVVGALFDAFLGGLGDAEPFPYDSGPLYRMER